MVSPNAKACPKCGCAHPTGKPAPNPAVKAIVISLGVLVSCGFVMWQFGEATRLTPQGEMFKRLNDEADSSPALQRIREAKRQSEEGN